MVSTILYLPCLFHAGQTSPNKSYQDSTLKLVFLQPSKIPAADAGCWLETQISNATDTTTNLTWIYIFHLAAGCWQASLSSDRGNSKGNTKVTKNGKGHEYRKNNVQ